MYEDIAAEAESQGHPRIRRPILNVYTLRAPGEGGGRKGFAFVQLCSHGKRTALDLETNLTRFSRLRLKGKGHDGWLAIRRGHDDAHLPDVAARAPAPPTDDDAEDLVTGWFMTEDQGMEIETW